MKGGPISELLITKTGHRPTQYKKITNTVPVLCVDKNFWNLNEVIWTEHNLVERNLVYSWDLILEFYLYSNSKCF